MKPIFLIGYMGSGKSTLGRTLSRVTGVSFIDLDAYIENRFHATVREIFASRGEKGFREIERNMLHEVGEMNDVIVACGGGTPCYFDNMDYMNASGTTVLLEAPLNVLHSRLMRGRHKRPLIADKNADELRDFIVKALEERIPHYGKSAHRFSSALLENETEITETAERFINQFLHIMPGEQSAEKTE
ncbi:MAG: shikimate kinase [Muribaculaceae bacterium]|nr:shikimate kinase [Muribaculaceae bacterium]